MLAEFFRAFRGNTIIATLMAQPVQQIVLIFLCNIEQVQNSLTMQNISQVQYISPMRDMGLR